MFDLASTLQRFERAVAPRVPLVPHACAIPTVYHYTTPGGFAGIVSEQRLRATNFAYLNDPTEIEYGRELIKRVLARTAKGKPSERGEFLEHVSAHMRVEDTAEVYVTCFSEGRDDLAQWRGYGVTAAERYALGFSTEAIDSLTSRHVNMLWARVLYDPDEQLHRIHTLIDRAWEFLQAEQVDRSTFKPFAQLFGLGLARIVPTLKAKAYEAESEWRAILRPSPNAVLEFDVVRGVVRPFLTWSLGQAQTITDVVVLAPTRRRLALKAAEMLLRQAKIDNVKPVHSDVPFVD